jgi:DNA-binding MarR family transcriptional regulator
MAAGKQQKTATVEVPNWTKATDAGSTTEHQDILWQLVWDITSINAQLDALCRFKAKALDISGRQWTILMALTHLDDGDGVPAKIVSELLHVDPSFVTSQSKLLEKRGFVRRKPSTTDRRVVQMSLTDRTYKHLANAASQQAAMNQIIFSNFDPRDFAEFTSKLTALKLRLEKARLRLALDV